MPVALLVLAALSAACSISTSSKSSSDLASSPSSVSSGSKDKAKAGFETDVRDYTAEFAKSTDGKLEDFRARMGKIADQYGLAHWDEDKSTYVAIGKGLRKAGLGQSQYEAFKASLGGGAAWKMDAIAEGYR
jgi:hypothetical protein